MNGIVGERRKARIVAFKALFETDCVGHASALVLERLLENSPLSPSRVEFAKRLVAGVVENLERIDEVIHATAPEWPMDQLSKVDKNILRLAIFEILINNDVPPKAAINEAVEMAKSFGGDNSYKFINGVLGTVMRSHSPSAPAGEFI